MSKKEIWEDWEGDKKIEKNTETFKYNLEEWKEYIETTLEKEDSDIEVTSFDGDGVYKLFLENNLYTITSTNGIKNKNIDLKGCSNDFKLEKIGGKDCIITVLQIYFIEDDDILTIPLDAIFFIAGGKIHTTYEFNNNIDQNIYIQYINADTLKFENNNEKIILTSSERFIIFNNDSSLHYEGKKGEEFIEYSEKDNIIIKNKHGLFYIYNVEQKERKFLEYEDEYEVKGGKIVNFIINKFNLEIGKLKLPTFIDIEEFLELPYFGDSVAIALGDEQYKRKTFSECSKIGDFIDIYIAGGNIFTDKSEVIKEKVSLSFVDGDNKFKNGSNLNKITEVIKGKIDKMKNIINIDLD